MKRAGRVDAFDGVPDGCGCNILTTTNFGWSVLVTMKGGYSFSFSRGQLSTFNEGVVFSDRHIGIIILAAWLRRLPLAEHT